MPPLLVRLNLPGFSSPEPFRLERAPPSMTGLACAVLEEIGGFTKEELEGVRNNLDRVPLTLLGELCAGQLVELASDAELEVFLATAESPRGPAIIEVRPRDVGADQSFDDGPPSPEAAPQNSALVAHSQGPSTNGCAGAERPELSQPGTAVPAALEAARMTAESPASQGTTAQTPVAGGYAGHLYAAGPCQGSQQQQHPPPLQQSVQQEAQQPTPPPQQWSPPPQAQRQLQQGPQQSLQPMPQNHQLQQEPLQQEYYKQQQQLLQPHQQPDALLLSPDGSSHAAMAAVPGAGVSCGTAASGRLVPEAQGQACSTLDMSPQLEANGSFERHRHPGGGTSEQRTRTPDAQRRTKLRGAAPRASTPPCERRPVGREERRPVQDSSAVSADRGLLQADSQLMDNSSSQATRSSGAMKAYCHKDKEAPAHIRLYQEKDDRRRRLEEARLRRLEQEEEDIRTSAQRALGRATSPARCQSPSRDAGVSPVPSRNATPPRTRPPLPDRPSSANSGSGSHAVPQAAHASKRRSPGGSSAVAPGGGSTGTRSPAAPSADSAGGASRGRTGAPQQVPVVPVAEALKAEPSAPAAASSPSRHLAMADASSVASESQAPGMQSVASVATLAGEDSVCGDGPAAGDELQSLRQQVAQQQQRIEFLETMHQQALRQLRKARDELHLEQQKRFREADKVLALEQLISEMQAQRFEGDSQMQLRWEEWLQRSRSILEAD
mmetsp:Transcript_108562/g.324620  ORF Transcript_108562/g.324620 Transcript_108562/m.324620 type:complete len:723 (-) Transcript_108562:60-2228(-)